MQHENISEAEIGAWLNTLGVTSLCQWDVLFFVYRHQASLVGADLIARLLGYANGQVVDALDVLEFLGLVERSRVSQIARFYQFIRPSDPERGNAWKRLLALASHRVGRVRLAVHLRGGDQSVQAWLRATQHILAEGLQSVKESRQGMDVTQGSLADAQRRIQASRQRLQPNSEGDSSWLKAI
jgi:hypothetical protein